MAPQLKRSAYTRLATSRAGRALPFLAAGALAQVSHSDFQHSHIRAVSTARPTREGHHMAKRKESGTKRQERIQREQHRPEQNKGYDEAVREGGPVLPNDTDKVSYLPPEPPDARAGREQHDIDERETQRAIADVRRQEHSAD